MPWYETGLRFHCQRCGKCCSTAGHVVLTDGDITAMAATLDMTREVFLAKYTGLSGSRRVILDATQHACPFLVETVCSIQEAKPMQCRTWPWWGYNLADTGTWEDAKLRCPGIGIGELHYLSEIETMRLAAKAVNF